MPQFALSLTFPLFCTPMWSVAYRLFALRVLGGSPGLLTQGWKLAYNCARRSGRPVMIIPPKEFPP